MKSRDEVINCNIYITISAYESVLHRVLIKTPQVSFAFACFQYKFRAILDNDLVHLINLFHLRQHAERKRDCSNSLPSILLRIHGQVLLYTLHAVLSKWTLD